MLQNNLASISVIILTKNSEDFLAECLQALAAFAEIVVLDNDSTDRTRSIAATFLNVRLFEHPFIGFGPMKNMAANFASHDWILSIDSDEIVSPALIQEIAGLSLNENSVYRFHRHNYYRKKLVNACGWQNDRIVRLYHRQRTRFSDKKVHEGILTDGLQVVDCQAVIKHYSFQNIEGLLDKLDRYTTLYAQEHRFRKKASLLNAYAKKVFHFWNDYLTKGGWRYGYEGFVIAMSNANGAFYKQMKLYEANQSLAISLIISTYNRKDALELVLKSVPVQKLLPLEVIVADDGSREDTKELVEAYQSHFPVPLRHCWQPDNGFQLAQIRNKAIAMAKGEYIVMIDGDMVMHPLFLQDHLQVAEKECFIQGSRVLLSPETTDEALKKSLIYFAPTANGIKNRLNATHLSFMRQLLAKKTTKLDGIRGCNMGFWKEDCLAVNGFNEAFVGWGREDSEFVVRLFNKGIRRKNLKFGGIGYHLYHAENNRAQLPENERILQEAINQKSTRCEKGIHQYLDN
ncbi:glycosyltransferase family 2 protein [Rhodoflexus sp.]